MSSKQHNCPKMTAKGKVNYRKGKVNGTKPKKTEKWQTKTELEPSKKQTTVNRN